MFILANNKNIKIKVITKRIKEDYIKKQPKKIANPCVSVKIVHHSANYLSTADFKRPLASFSFADTWGKEKIPQSHLQPLAV